MRTRRFGLQGQQVLSPLFSGALALSHSFPWNSASQKYSWRLSACLR